MARRYDNDARDFIESTERPKWERATEHIKAVAWLHGFYAGASSSAALAGLVLIVLTIAK